MKKGALIIAGIICCSLTAAAQKAFTFTALFQQCGMYYSSDRVTADGVGLGLGLHVLHRSGVAAQTDASLLWLNGNAVPVRLAVGYQKKGRWVPGVYATVDAIFGQQTRILSESGEIPPVPAWSFGFRIVPLKFALKSGFVSVLEFGCGTGPGRALNLELTLLSAGISF